MTHCQPCDIPIFIPIGVIPVIDLSSTCHIHYCGGYSTLGLINSISINKTIQLTQGIEVDFLFEPLRGIRGHMRFWRPRAPHPPVCNWSVWRQSHSLWFGTIVNRAPSLSGRNVCSQGHGTQEHMSWVMGHCHRELICPGIEFPLSRICEQALGHWVRRTMARGAPVQFTQIHKQIDRQADRDTDKDTDR